MSDGSYGLNAADTRALSQLGMSLASKYESVTNPAFIEEAREYAAQLPAELTRICRLNRRIGYTVIRGLPVSEPNIGTTPGHWSDVDPAKGMGIDFILVLVGLLVGEVFAWPGQQDGRLVHDIVPTQGNENLQIGSGSSAKLELHTEDAFHRERGHVIVLACMRNQERVATYVAGLRNAPPPESVLAGVMRPSLNILPDASYFEGDDHGPGPDQAPLMQSVWATPDGLCIRYDPSYTRLPQGDVEVANSYDALTMALADNTQRIVLDPGDVLLLENDVLAHGREPFAARYNGTDRWLKRVNVHVSGRTRPAEEAAERGFGQEVAAIFRR